MESKDRNLKNIQFVGEENFVSPQQFTFDEDFEVLGGTLKSFTLAYETYGELNDTRDNAILICHALTGDHHAAGYHECPHGKNKEATPGWWNHVIGPGKAIDTNKFFVVCSNVLGACQGSTGPTSLKADGSGEKYGADFPDFSIGDMVRAQKKLLDELSVKTLLAVVGGSMGGMQALQWIVDYPLFVQKSLIIAATPRHSAQTIAFNEVGRQAIQKDHNWTQGAYTNNQRPEDGLGVARMMAHITYLSDLGMEEKFRNKTNCKTNRNLVDEVRGYLSYQAEKFINRFDANTYLKLTRALDNFDLIGENGLDETFKAVQSKVMVVAFSSDWLYTPQQNQLIVESLQRLGKEASYVEIDHMHGHDSFLINSKDFLSAVKAFFSGADSIDHGQIENHNEGTRKNLTIYDVKKESDFRVIDEWVPANARVLDLGCGSGLLLEYLKKTKQVSGLGVDFDLAKATSCIARDVPVYQQDIRHALANQADQSYDWVIFSRMVEELSKPGEVILEALRVGRRVAVSFVNYGYWRNRIHFMKKGRRIRNDVFPNRWEESSLRNHFSINEFEQFCLNSKEAGYPIEIGRKVFHQGDWKKQCCVLPNLRAGLAIYELISH